ncbi:MAG: hypothetical protein ACO3NL_15370, partial [Phycisphaerales bacterium]
MRRTTLFGTIVMAAATGVASAQSTEIGRIQVGPVAAAATAAPQVETVMVAPAAATTAVDPYDFGLIVQTLQGSVRPLSQELDQSFGSFTAKIEQAVTLMDEGRTEAAVELSVEAIQEVLAVRENVIEPMWEAQTYLASRIGEIRGRLATAVESSKPGQTEPDRSADVL